jgi:metal-responsive CopG/Arc/MetJ family transcriptional regulator
MLKVERPRPVTLSLDDELDKLLTARALNEGTSRSELVRRLLRLGLSVEKNREKVQRAQR